MPNQGPRVKYEHEPILICDRIFLAVKVSFSERHGAMRSSGKTGNSKPGPNFSHPKKRNPVGTPGKSSRHPFRPDLPHPPFPFIPIVSVVVPTTFAFLIPSDISPPRNPRCTKDPQRRKNATATVVKRQQQHKKEEKKTPPTTKNAAGSISSKSKERRNRIHIMQINSSLLLSSRCLPAGLSPAA